MTLGTDARGSATHLSWLGPPLEPLDDTGTVTGWSAGYAFLDDGTVREGVDVARHLARATAAHIDDAVEHLNGCFACVIVFPDRAVLAVDRGGTTPIYTATVDGRYVASVDPWQVVEAVGANAQLDDGSVLDMLRLGYVAGDRTLVRDVRLVPSGTVVQVTNHRATARRYWMFRPYADKVETDAPLEAALRSNIDAVVKLLDGRVAGVPLSGGLDTRVITTLLHHCGADVRAFTYGPPGEPEVEVGASVAAALGVKHEIIPIDQHYIEDAFISTSAATVGLTTRFTCGLGARHVADHDIDVFVPGHGGCYSDYQLGVFNAPVSSRRQAWQYVYFKHYQLDRDDVMPGRLFDVDYDAVRWSSVAETMSELDLHGDVVGEMYRWSVENRQRKLIAMEQRTYERLGPWVFPLHDHRVTDFFLSAPRRLLASQRAYKQVAGRIFDEYAPGLAQIPRIGGGLAYDPKVAVYAAVLTATRPVSGLLLQPLMRRSHGFDPSPPKPKGAESIRHWFNRDASTRDYLLDRVAAADIPRLRRDVLRDALLDADNDKLFTRTLAGAITVQEVEGRLRGLRTAPSSRPDSVAS
jgi:asparagine synthase (glutamine-hydrolysing)